MQTKQFRLYTVYINADLNGFLIIFNYSCAYSTNATFTSNKEDMFSLLFVCLLLTLLKNFQTDLQEIFREGWQWPNEQMVKFLVAIWITVWIQGLLSRFVTIRRYGKSLTDKSAAYTDLPDGGTSKTCLGVGMHCPSASSFLFNALQVMHFFSDTQHQSQQSPVFSLSFRSQHSVLNITLKCTYSS